MPLARPKSSFKLSSTWCLVRVLTKANLNWRREGSMSLDLGSFEAVTGKAIKAFWATKRTVAHRRATSDISLKGFAALIGNIVLTNGLSKSNVIAQISPVAVSGHFPSIQSWDIIVVNGGRPIHSSHGYSLSTYCFQIRRVFRIE